MLAKTKTYQFQYGYNIKTQAKTFTPVKMFPISSGIIILVVLHTEAEQCCGILENLSL